MRRLGGSGAVLVLLSVGACVGDAPALPVPDAGMDAGFDSTADAAGGDATPSDAASPDAADAITGPRCDPSKAWGAPKEVLGINTGSLEGGARLSPDELTLYFTSDRPPSSAGHVDIWVSTRPDRNSSFGNPTYPSGITLTLGQLWPSPTADGLKLYYVQDNEVGLSDLMKATRPTSPGTFATAAVVPSLASNVGLTCPYILPDESALYFSARTSAFNKSNLYRASPPGSTPVAIGELNGDPYDTYCATVLPNELEMVFNSNRSTGSDHQLYATKRAKTSDPWGTPTLITQLNTAADEFANWVSPDGCALYFQRNTSSGSLNYDLWYSVKPP